MARALALAALADGRTSPNPLVGCVVLDANGELVGEGYHRQAGEPHAEVMALRRAGDRAKGGTLYVTLEPCCHHGRTPPCSEAVIAAGLRRVVIALDDPDPRVAGGGIAQLKAAGIEVISGVRQAEAAQQNRAFLHRLRTGRPWGLLKWAMSLDGRTALSNGASQWISSPPARSWVHQLRAGVDAVIVGGGTVRADNPLLTSRGQRNPEPLRVVLSRTLSCPRPPSCGIKPAPPRWWPMALRPQSKAKQQLDQLGGGAPGAQGLRTSGFARGLGAARLQPGAVGMRPAIGGGRHRCRLRAGNRGRGGTSAVGRRSSPHAPGRSGLHRHGSGDSPCAQQPARSLGSDWLFQSLLPED